MTVEASGARHLAHSPPSGAVRATPLVTARRVYGGAARAGGVCAPHSGAGGPGGGAGRMGGASPWTPPPYLAISFTRLDRRNEYSGLVVMNSVSTFAIR